MNFNDPKVIKQLLGQGVTTQSPSGGNPDSEGAENPRKQAKRLSVEEYISLNESWLTRVALYALRDFASKSSLIAPESGASGPSAPADKAAPEKIKSYINNATARVVADDLKLFFKNDSYFSTHLKRTGDFIEPADY